MPCYCVKWRKEKYNGQTLTKLTSSDGHMPSDSHSKMLKILRKILTAREHLANFIRRVHVSIKLITSRAQIFINIFVQSVPPKAKNIDMLPKIIVYLFQKTRQALQNCSVKCRMSV